MKNERNCLCLTCLFYVVLVFGVHAEIRLPAVFSDNMVLQQQSQVAVWGWAKPNTHVSVIGSWDKKRYSIKSDTSGYWLVKVTTPESGFTPYTITVSDGEPVTIKNILIGEVWICSGQSNMQMPMRGRVEINEPPIVGGSEAIASSTLSGVRCFNLKRTIKTEPQDDCEGIWELANPQTTPGFSATGYFFACVINRMLNVPVGLIHTSYGGSRIEAWMSAGSLRNFHEITIPTKDTDISHRAEEMPTLLYNGMIHPIAGYGIRGVIWYQGESNIDAPDLYVKLFDTMVRDWRNLWGVGEFPFYYCQIAPYDYGSSSHSALFREAQAKCMTVTPNTGMAVLMDVGAQYEHPPRKREAGERLALWALAKTYGVDSLPYRSPELMTIEIEGRMAVLTFDVNFDPGLYSINKEMLNFRIAGQNRQFYPTKATCWGNKVFLFSPQVAEPVAVRYCFENDSAAELFGIESNLPVGSFRTDEW